MRRIAEKVTQSINEIVGHLNNPPLQHSSEVNRSRAARRTRATSTSAP